MRIFLSIAGILIFVAGLGAGFLDHLQVMWASCLGLIGCLIAANLDRISEFTASATGVTAKTRDVINRAESAVTQLQALAVVVAEVTLSLVKRNGRMGGYSDRDADAVRERVLSTLDKLGVPRIEVPRVMEEWHRITAYDYLLAVSGGHTVPPGASPAAVQEWKALRSGGFSNTTTPGELRDFMAKYGYLTSERESYIQDFEYYLKHKTHRRPSIWEQREEWATLTKTQASASGLAQHGGA